MYIVAVRDCGTYAFNRPEDATDFLCDLLEDFREEEIALRVVGL